MAGPPPLSCHTGYVALGSAAVARASEHANSVPHNQLLVEAYSATSPQWETPGFAGAPDGRRGARGAGRRASGAQPGEEDFLFRIDGVKVCPRAGRGPARL